MDPNLDKRLAALEGRVEDIYKMVRRMRGAQQRAAALKLAYWAFFIILSIYAVNALKPYLSQLTEAYGSVSDTTKGYSDLLKSINQ